MAKLQFVRQIKEEEKSEERDSDTPVRLRAAFACQASVPVRVRVPAQVRETVPDTARGVLIFFSEKATLN